MSAQVTEAHRELARRIMFEFTQAGTATASDVRMAAQIIADSEAKACAELRGALALGQQNCDEVFEDLRNERDQLRAEVERLKATPQTLENAVRWEDCERMRARAERAEAELAVANASIVSSLLYNTLKERLSEAEAELAAERARLDYILRTCAAGVFYNAESREAIDAEMKEGA